MSVALRMAAGESVDVSAAAREIGTSRQTLYRYAARVRVDGVEGAFLRSRAPLRSPGRVHDAVGDVVELARKELDRQGWDNGAQSIQWWMLDHPDQWRQGRLLEQVSVPSRATIHRILVRRALVVPQPRKRPRRLGHRFTRPVPNDLWQIDGYDYVLSDGTPVTVIEVIDDHSRLLLASRACVSENSRDAWGTFCAAATSHGLPRQLLSDNGTAFNGRRRGWTARLEAAVTNLGVEPITSSIRRPQTCGKVERHHATSQRWLSKQPAPATLPQLQALLDDYRNQRNHRRHQGLNGLTPHQVWTLTQRAGPVTFQAAPTVTHRPVSPAGCIMVDHAEISLGRKHAGHTATVFREGDHILAFIDGQLARELVIDRNRRYQPKSP